MKNETFVTCMGLIVSVLVVGIVAALANGWALVTIWNWFIPPIFGLTYLTLWQAVGVSMVFSIFTGTNNTQKNKSDTSNKSFGEVFVESLVLAILVPLLTVIFAYVVRSLAF